MEPTLRNVPFDCNAQRILERNADEGFQTTATFGADFGFDLEGVKGFSTSRPERDVAR